MLINSFYFRNCVTLCSSCSQLLGQLPGKLQQSSIYLSILGQLPGKLYQSSIYLYLDSYQVNSSSHLSIYPGTCGTYISIYLNVYLSFYASSGLYLSLSSQVWYLSIYLSNLIYISIQSHIYIYHISSIYLLHLIY